jgi:hypothetical protein
MKLPKNPLYYSYNILKQFGPIVLPVESANSLAYKKFLQSDLYSDDTLKTKNSSIFYDISILQIDTTIYDSEQAIISLKDGCINFTVTIVNNTDFPGQFISGNNYSFDITGGTGKYLGAKGFVNIAVSKSGLRTITFSK